VVFYHQPRNCVPVMTWLNDPKDTTMLKLLEFFGELTQMAAPHQDVRPVLLDMFKMDKMMEAILKNAETEDVHTQI
jgi:hypothetical protein